MQRHISCSSHLASRVFIRVEVEEGTVKVLPRLRVQSISELPVVDEGAKQTR